MILKNHVSCLLSAVNSYMWSLCIMAKKKLKHWFFYQTIQIINKNNDCTVILSQLILLLPHCYLNTDTYASVIKFVIQLDWIPNNILKFLPMIFNKSNYTRGFWFSSTMLNISFSYHFLCEILLSTVCSYLCNLDVSKACGPDLIPALYFKSSAEAIASPLCYFSINW